MSKLMQNKKGLILGVANDKGISGALMDQFTDP